MVVNPITVNNFAFLFDCTPAGRASDQDDYGLKIFKCRLVPDAQALVGPTGVQMLVFFCFSRSLFLAVESSSLFHLCIRLIFYILGDVPLMG